MNVIRDIVWPENLIRVRFLPFVILKCVFAVLLGPAAVCGAGYILFMLDERWPAHLGRGIIPVLIIALAFMVYLMVRFVIVFNADVFTSGKLIIRNYFMLRKSIQWTDIISVETDHRDRLIKLMVSGNREYILKGFRKTSKSDGLTSETDHTMRSSYEYRFHGLKAGITIQQYVMKLLNYLPPDKIIRKE